MMMNERNVGNRTKSRRKIKKADPGSHRSTKHNHDLYRALKFIPHKTDITRSTYPQTLMYVYYILVTVNNRSNLTNLRIINPLTSYINYREEFEPPL